MIPRLGLTLYLLVIASSCAAGPETVPAEVNLAVELREYTVTLTPATAKAGTVKIGIKNAGNMPHEFELIKTDLAVDKLPVDGGTAKAKEDGLVKQVLNIEQGKVAVVSAALAPGRYVVLCNVAGHYQLGMRAELRVE